MTDLDMDALLAEKRREALDQLRAACLVLADMLKAKGYVPEATYCIGERNPLGPTYLRVSASGQFEFFYSDAAFEEAVRWIAELPTGYSATNCAAWFQPEAIST